MDGVYTWSHPKLRNGRWSPVISKQTLIETMLYIACRRKVSVEDMRIGELDEQTFIPLRQMTGDEVIDEFNIGSALKY